MSSRNKVTEDNNYVVVDRKYLRNQAVDAVGLFFAPVTSIYEALRSAAHWGWEHDDTSGDSGDVDH